MDTHTVAFPEPQASPHSPVEEGLSPLSPGAESKISRAKVCPECGKVLYKPHSYSMHVRSHRPWLKCDVCPFKTKEAKILKLHKIVHKRNPDNVCDICHKYYSTDMTLRVHQKKFHGIHQCRYCGTEFTSGEELRDHLRKTYDRRENLPRCMDISILRQISPQSKDADKSQLTCPLCKKVSRNKYRFQLHLAQHRVSSKDTSDHILDTAGELQKQKKQNQVSNKHKNSTSASSEGSTFHVPVKTEDMTEELSETTSKAEVIPELLFNTSFSSAPTVSSGRTLLIYNPVGEALPPVINPHFLQELPHSTANELKRSPATHITTQHCIPNTQAVASSSSTTPLVTSVPDASPDTSSFNIKQTSVASSDVTYNEEITEAERKGSLSWCAHCPSAFPTPGDVRKHSQEMHPHGLVPQFPLCRVSNQMITKPKTSGPKKRRRKMELRCDVCRNVFSSNKVLTKHKKYKHRKSFECSDCDVVHKAAHKLLRHQKLYHKDKYRCRYACGVLFDTYTDLVNHYKRVHQKDYTKSECPYCRKLYVFETSLKNHIEKCKDTPIDKRPAHTCGNCEGVFLNIETYKEHAKSCLPSIKKYKCNAPSTGLRKKKEAKTLGGADVNVALEPLACISGESVEIIKGKNVNNESIYSDDLDTSNSSGSSSEEHSSTDMQYEIRPRSPTAWCVKCKYCPDVFLEKKKVVSHILSWHEGLVTRMTVAHQECEVCGMIFKNTTCLCKHLLKHYTCLKMWDAFVPRDILKLVKVEGYYCWICKTTKQLPQYSHHGIHRDMVIDEVLEIEDLDNTAIEPFECDKCSKLFSTRKEFWKHVKNHLADLSREHFRHGDPQDPNSSRLFECSECQFKCAEKDELYQHIASHFVEEDKATTEISEKEDEGGSSD